MPNAELLQLSESLLYNTKIGAATFEIEFELENIELQQLISELTNDEAKKTFWINMYNSWYQILSARDNLKNPDIFSERKIPIAGVLFSLDEIEHGILRKYRWKYSLGYLPNIFTKKLIKRLAVLKMDYRIHFALNCGAKSCPPIAFYSYNKIDSQLDVATKSFMTSETIIDDFKKEINVTKIMYWFSGDFGGKNGIRAIVKKVIGKDVNGYRIKFKPYNWEDSLHNFE